MKKKLFFGPMLAVYIATIVLIRLFFFFADKIGFPEPGLVIGGVHAHHYVFGLAILLFGVLGAIEHRISSFVLSSFFGIGLALVMDEFQFLLVSSTASYPTSGLPVFVVGLMLGFGLLLEERPGH